MKTLSIPILRNWLLLQLLLLMTALLLVQPALASREDDRRDPPTRVARVAEVQGNAEWFDPEQRDWQPLLRNQTLAEGDRLRVQDRARVGLRIGPHALWLDERSQLEIRRLDEQRIDLDLEQGAIALRFVTSDTARDAQVRTQEGRFSFERAGAYRVDQLQRTSRAQAFEGRLRFDHRGEQGAPLFLDALEQAEVWWEAGPRAERGRLQRQDGFGDFLAASLGFGRDDQARWRERPAYRYVSPELTGADELDQHGRWESSAEFGPIWTPLRVAVEWAPFRYGRWNWTRHWGWTWIDDNPWGYATSHYGRWVHWRGRWCWTPGAVIVPRPVFAPALVAWVGSGSGVQIGVQIGGRYRPPVAWVPLAPHETYRPWYRHSPRYGQYFSVDPNPHTVRRPLPQAWVGHNRAVPGAISTFGRSAGDNPVLRPMPLRADADLSQMAPLQQAPTRQFVRELAQSPQQLQQLPAGQSTGPAMPLRELQGRGSSNARGEDGQGPNVRAGGSGGLGRAEGSTMPTRQEPRQQAMPGEPSRPQPQLTTPERRELPWRQEAQPRAQPMPMEQPLGRQPMAEPQPMPQQPSRDEWRRERERERERTSSRDEMRDDRQEQRMPWRQAAPVQERQEARPAQRMEMPQVQAPVQPQPQRMEMPMRRIEVPRSEPQPQRAAEPPRREREKSDDAGPRRQER